MSKTITTEVFFEAMRLISALDIKADIKDLVRQQSEGQKMDQFAFGYELIMRIFEKAVQVNSEKKIYSFLSKILEKPAEEIREQSFITLIDDVLAVADIEEWKSLFTKVAGLIIQK